MDATQRRQEDFEHRLDYSSNPFYTGTTALVLMMFCFAKAIFLDLPAAFHVLVAVDLLCGASFIWLCHRKYKISPRFSNRSSGRKRELIS